ncbi:MAG: hypothetical protein UT05_C0003G0079 [Parcubacteria group bacterium GW2011_GWF2_38_76]|nr:MAG: hypothetical protein UT05_C0003G0079 [Parcubacteria group bacterium GW2011_GWF2_38_76]HBM46148.1 hypothetical protein [Patescibacteria group bacterium]
MRKKILKTIIAFILFSPLIGLTATVYPSIGGNVMFTLEPKNPGPNSQATIKVSSYVIDTTEANISWYLGDKLEMEGIGKDIFSFKTGSIGKPIIIKMIADINGQRMGRAISIIPAEVDIVWEANTYVHPSYKGKAMASPKSSIKIIAIPQFKTENGTTIPTNELKYEWKKGTAIILSGLGKNIFNTDIGSPLAEEEIKLLVSDRNGQITTEKIITIIPEDPEIIFYKENPTEGTEYNNSLTGYVNLEEKEISVRAEPFFFSYPSSAKEANLMFSWNINEKGVLPNDGTPKIITLRNESGQGLTSSISLSIKNAYKVFQEATNDFILESTAGFKF